MRAMTKIVLRSASTLGGLGLGLLMGCLVTGPREGHCYYNDGDATCAERHSGEAMYCNTCVHTPAKDGCVADRPDDDACYSPCGGETRIADDASCLEFTGTGSTSDEGGSTMDTDGSSAGTDTMDPSESSTTGAMPCTENEECMDPAAPFCEPVSGECVTCAATDDPDGACAGLDPGAPLCVGGACVQCTAENPAACDEQLLLCDDASNTCVQCAAHDECASGGCELAVGRCFPPGDVLHVDGDGGADHSTVTAAVATVADGAFAVIVVHGLDSGGAYQGSVILDGGKTIALRGAPGEFAVTTGIGANPGLRIAGAGTVAYVDGLAVSNSPAVGVAVEGALAWIDRGHIVGNDGGGILAQNGAEVTLRNSFVGGNVEANVLALQGATAEVLYTTLGAGLGVTTSITCDAGGMATVRNSLIVSRSDDDEVTCANLDASYTAAEMMLGGTGNVALGAMQTTWFMNFNGGDFHLTTAPVSIATTAQWEAGDPAVDIDGDDRPNTDGASDFAGADRP